MLLFFCQSSSSCSPSSSCTVSNMVGFCFFLSSSPCSCVNLWPNKYTIVRRAKVAKVTKMISKEYWGGMASTRACSSLHSGLWETYVYSYSKNYSWLIMSHSWLSMSHSWLIMSRSWLNMSSCETTNLFMTYHVAVCSQSHISHHKY